MLHPGDQFAEPTVQKGIKLPTQFKADGKLHNFPSKGRDRSTKPRKRPSGGNVKQHRSYTVDEAARLLKVHKVTVRNWIKTGGLPALAEQRPTLILGSELKRFLTQRRAAGKQPCRLDECYCLKCRTPRRPASGKMEFSPLTPTKGNLLALCEVCGCTMRKHISIVRLPHLQSLLAIKIRHVPARITGSTDFCLNAHFDGGH
jgi:excisionase family DNA binding protein